MEKRKTSFQVSLILLVLMLLQISKQSSLFVTNYSWEPIQEPLISEGTIIQILLDPSDFNHLYALQQSKDLSYILLESRDAAVSWNAIYYFTDSISNLTIDPINPTIIYAGTSVSILRSTNSGRTWMKVADYGPVIASPAANTIYSIETMEYSNDCPSGNKKFVASHDGGTTWDKHLFGCYSIHQITTTSNYPDSIYVRAENEFNPVLFHSEDGGMTWEAIPLIGGWFMNGFLPISVDPAQPEKLFTSSGSGIIISSDGGLTWRSVLDVPTVGPFRFSFSSGVIYAGIDPIVYGDLPILYLSDDGGETWKELPGSVPDRLNDIQVLLFTNKVLVAVEGWGIYQSDNNGLSWKSANTGIRSAVVVDKMASSQSNPEIIYAISRWPRHALFRSDDEGQSWSEPVLETVINSIVVHPFNPYLIWIADESGILETTNGGEDWRRVAFLPVRNLTVSTSDPDRPCAIYNDANESSILCREKKERNRGFYWVKNPILGIRDTGLLVFSPTNGKRMMLSGRAVNAEDYSIFASKDGGITWHELFQGPSNYLPLELAFSGGQPAKAIAVYFQYHPDNIRIYESLDTGETWQEITNELEIVGGEMWTGWTYKASVVYSETGTLFFGTKNIVLQKIDNVHTWKVIWDKKDLIEDMLILKGSRNFLLISSRQNFWKTQLPILMYLWMPIIVQQ